MAINLTKVLTQIQNRIGDSTTNARDLNKLIAAASRINNSGTQVLTYQSTGQLPSLADSNYIGVIARVASDNVFGDSDGRYYYASGTDSGWRGFKTTQDSADALIEAPAAGGAAGPDTVRLGETAGYVMGGSGSTDDNTTEKFLFAAGTSAAGSVISGLTAIAGGRYLAAAAQSPTHAYHAGGYGPPPSPSVKDTIEKFPFAAEDTSTDVGNLTSGKAYISGTSSPTHGYAHGGFPPNSNVIQKYSTSSDGDATDVGDVTATVYGAGGAQSENHGYVVGGYQLTGSNRIQKYSFASDGNATAVGATTLGPVIYYLGHNGQSTTHGYQVGGTTGSVKQDIAKFAFASDGDATDVGDLIQTQAHLSGHSATDGYIYITGGEPSPSGSNNIQRIAYGSDGNAVDCGDLAADTKQAGGAHV